MNPIDLIMTLLAAISSIPAVGPILAKVVIYAAAVGGVATALVGVLHAIVASLKALSLIPGLSGLSALGDKLKQADDSVEGIMNEWVLPILNRLSVLPVPKAPAALPKP